ncbi:mitochondrial carrier, pyruvate Mpc1 [Schizosaccharomyces pombe]|uniref:Probable mitochondrial pyruvate carrier 1 n=1 Tax=Schizosaccharomyces pombe (strain 972 / ATCC 24843) TaxID=284812 RepID=MPC1_SCHPO|nr:BRP44L family protein [Schizosaccharomyces pombe]O74847.3 RecName: Full=Probable mitochondrial pyruvate carrier 1; Short=MPC1 [Schizosaccharomyces pombe 972h-]CAA21115.2 mitochondrial protein, human BRP44L ortholog [Schizosaccharomyces pombe]|eukprot:NP_587737.1 BRP44L family protein [Schizosaccharomyces pombe]
MNASEKLSQKAAQSVTRRFITWLKSPDFRKYLCSTHFWGPLSNFGIPIAAILDLKKDPRLISGRMTGALILYSSVFMRYAWMVSPRNYLLLGCHAFNTTVQTAQGIRFVNFWYGKEGASKQSVFENIMQAAKHPESGTRQK